MSITQDRLSLFNLLLPVTVLIPEGVNPDITTDVVQFQFILGGLPPRARPVEDDWIDGTWTRLDNGIVLATLLVGPTATVIAPGKWAIWLRIVDNPTKPVAPVDVLTIT